MLSSPNPQISSSLHLTALSRSSSISFTSFTSSSVAQSLPIFPTPSKHRAYISACNSIPFMRLLHTSRHTGGGGLLPVRKPFLYSPASSRSNSRPADRLTRFPATLTDTSQLAENPATLSPAFATLTRRVKHKSCVCHSYRKHPGGRGANAQFLQGDSRPSMEVCRSMPSYTASRGNLSSLSSVTQHRHSLEKCTCTLYWKISAGR
jgi:hypothetical protein